MNETVSIDQEQAYRSMEAIALELQGLHAGVSHLRQVYADAAASSDLTFIKMLEDKYASLTKEFAKLVETVDEMLNKWQVSKEG
ncbi:hypothetical protein B5M42_000870 [Paenibacillus athensensis]|uniref:Uncharacterized protein n=1 Tax=Paenibacillus athensensis TaxID=1967502 RepID=A0A4Y8Q734_9BACL|nr:hypothetical protein [Paenibacillus athensensis]MCD1257387.1 hypothetical protein [Paenibacillus athensensis]